MVEHNTVSDWLRLTMSIFKSRLRINIFLYLNIVKTVPVAMPVAMDRSQVYTDASVYPLALKTMSIT